MRVSLSYFQTASQSYCATAHGTDLPTLTVKASGGKYRTWTAFRSDQNGSYALYSASTPLAAATYGFQSLIHMLNDICDSLEEGLVD